MEVVYASEGTPLINAPSGVLKNAPNPNAARLFYSWLHGIEAQQLLVDFACRAFCARASQGEAGSAQALGNQADAG